MNDGNPAYGVEQDGAVYNFITNGDYVFDGYGNEFIVSYNTSSLSVTLLNGAGVICGRHVFEKKQNGQNTTLTLPANSSGYLVIRMDGTSTSFISTQTIVKGNLNNGDQIRDLPLYSYVTGENGVLSFEDLRFVSGGNSFYFTMENEVLYANYISNGEKVHKKISTKEV